MLFGGTFLIWQSVWVNRSRRAHGCQFSLSLFVAPQILLSDIYACCHSSLLNRKTHANAYHNFPSIFMIKHKHSQSVCFTVCEWMSGRKGNSIRKLSSLHCIRTFAHKYATHFFLSNESFFFYCAPHSFCARMEIWMEQWFWCICSTSSAMRATYYIYSIETFIAHSSWFKNAYTRNRTRTYYK